MSWSSRRIRRQMERAGRRAHGESLPWSTTSSAATRARRATPVNPVLLVLLVASVVGLLWQTGILTDVLSVTGPRNVIRVDGRLLAVPATHPDPRRALSAVPVTTSGAFSFQHTDGTGAPVGYDPCVPVRFVVRVDGAPQQGSELIADAVASIQAATGLSFESLGTTDEPLTDDREPIQARYGAGWAPVLFAWSDQAASPVLSGDVLGVGGSAVVPAERGRREFLAAGRVLLDGPDLAKILQRPGGYALARSVVTHELAHVVGLDHVNDQNELMAPRAGGVTQFGPGDLQGLAELGQITCDGS